MEGAAAAAAAASTGVLTGGAGGGTLSDDYISIGISLILNFLIN